MAAEPTPVSPVVPFPRPAGAPKTLAAIDVGSNSIKLLVARAEADGRMRVLAREKAMVRLGHETLRTGRLSEEAIAAGVAAIARYAGLARAAEAERILCVATCAVREAANAGELARRVKQACDLDLEVISGEEEARLVTLAVRSEFPASADPLLVVDIGGGSTEVIVSSGRKTPLAESLALGAVRLTERWVTTDPISKEEQKALEAEIDWQLKRVVESVQERGFRTAIGTSGTIAALASMGAALEGRAEAPTGRRLLSARTLKRVVAALTTTSARERAKMPGLESSRADIITAGGILLLRILKRLGVDELVVSDLSLREGLLLDALERAGHPDPFLARPGSVDELRAESVRRLAERTALERPHAEATRDLALALFDATHALHQLASREREWLEHAALLHDVGIAVGYRRHHRHSAYLIAHGEMKGFGAQEIEVIAQVARYHRKARPKESHEPFQRLDPWLKPIVEKLSALLRVADGLDGTHRQVVTGIAASVRRRNVVLTVSASANPELEIWTAKKKSALFERVFGRKLEIVPAAPWAAPEPPPD